MKRNLQPQAAKSLPWLCRLWRHKWVAVGHDLDVGVSATCYRCSRCGQVNVVTTFSTQVEVNDMITDNPDTNSRPSESPSGAQKGTL